MEWSQLAAGYNYSEIKVILSSFPRMNGHPGSMMPVPGFPIFPSVAKQAAMYGRQIKVGPRGLLGSLNPLRVPLPQAPGSVVSKDHHEMAQVEVNNTINQVTNSGTPERSEQPPSTVESGAGNGPADKAAYKRFNGKSKRRGRQSLKAGSMLR